MQILPAIQDDKPLRLTMKQRLFIDFYLGTAKFNAAEAARLAGYSLKTAKQMGYENLTKPRLVREIERRLDLMGLTTQEITARLSSMARGEAPTKTVVKGDETTATYDEKGALEDLGRIQGMYVDRHQVEAIQGLLIEDGE